MNILERVRSYVAESFEKNMDYEAAKDKQAFIDEHIDGLTNVELLRVMEAVMT